MEKARSYLPCDSSHLLKNKIINKKLKLKKNVKEIIKNYLGLSGKIQWAKRTNVIGIEVAKLKIRQSLIDQAIQGKAVVPVV